MKSLTRRNNSHFREMIFPRIQPSLFSPFTPLSCSCLSTFFIARRVYSTFLRSYVALLCCVTIPPTEISTHKYLGKCFYLLFVWLAVIGFRQNYFYILPNFWVFGAKMSFFHCIINQKRNNFIKHCPPPVYQEAADIRDVYLYKKFAVQVGSWYTGGTMFYRQKIKGVSAYNTQNTL